MFKSIRQLYKIGVVFFAGLITVYIVILVGQLHNRIQQTIKEYGLSYSSLSYSFENYNPKIYIINLKYKDIPLMKRCKVNLFDRSLEGSFAAAAMLSNFAIKLDSLGIKYAKGLDYLLKNKFYIKLSKQPYGYIDFNNAGLKLNFNTEENTMHAKLKSNQTEIAILEYNLIKNEGFIKDITNITKAIDSKQKVDSKQKIDANKNDETYRIIVKPDLCMIYSPNISVKMTKKLLQVNETEDITSLTPKNKGNNKGDKGTINRSSITTKHKKSQSEKTAKNTTAEDTVIEGTIKLDYFNRYIDNLSNKTNQNNANQNRNGDKTENTTQISGRVNYTYYINQQKLLSEIIKGTYKDELLDIQIPSLSVKYSSLKQDNTKHITVNNAETTIPIPSLEGKIILYKNILIDINKNLYKIKYANHIIQAKLDSANFSKGGISFNNTQINSSIIQLKNGNILVALSEDINISLSGNCQSQALNTSFYGISTFKKSGDMIIGEIRVNNVKFIDSRESAISNTKPNTSIQGVSKTNALSAANKTINNSSDKPTDDLSKQYILYSLHTSTGLGQIDFSNFEFTYPMKGGKKPFGERFTIFFNTNTKNGSCFGKKLSANVSLSDDGKMMESLFHLDLPNLQMQGNLEYDLTEKKIILDGSGKMLNGEDFLSNMSEDPYLPYKIDAKIKIEELTLSDNGGLSDTRITITNKTEWSLPHIQIHGKSYIKHEDKIPVKKELMHTKKPDPKKDMVHILIDGEFPKRKILIQSSNIARLCKTLNITIPISQGEAWIEGYIEPKYVEGTAYIYNFETTQGLGLLSLMRFISIGHWLNFILQPNENFWPKATAKWKYQPKEKLEIKDGLMDNVHQKLKLKGVINMKEDTLHLSGSIIPHTLWERIFGTALRLEFGTPFDVFGSIDNPQVKIENKTSVLPFFLP